MTLHREAHPPSGACIFPIIPIKRCEWRLRLAPHLIFVESIYRPVRYVGRTRYAGGR